MGRWNPICLRGFDDSPDRRRHRAALRQKLAASVSPHSDQGRPAASTRPPCPTAASVVLKLEARGRPQTSGARDRSLGDGAGPNGGGRRRLRSSPSDLRWPDLPFRYVVMEKGRGIDCTARRLPLRRTQGRSCGLRGGCWRGCTGCALPGFGSLDEERLSRVRRGDGALARRWAVPSSLRAEAALNELSGAGALDFEEAAGAMHIDRELRRRHRMPGAFAAAWHGDFTARHVFVDPASGAITGLIDFGDRMGGPPVWDLAGAWLSTSACAELPPNATGHVVAGLGGQRAAPESQRRTSRRPA